MDYKIITIRSLLRRARYYGALLTRQPPDVRFVIFAQGRTGSTLLNQLLDSHPRVRCDGEILNIGKTRVPLLDPYRYTLGAASYSGAKLYGYKVKVYQLTRHQRVDPGQFLRRVQTEGWKIIYLRRNNLLKQALSNVMANRTGRGRYKKNERIDNAPLRVDPDDLLQKISRREEYLEAEAEALDGLSYLEITYEQDLEADAAKQSTCDRIFEFLGVESYPVATDLKKINKDSLQDLIANYEEVKARVVEAGYGHHLAH